MSCYICVIIKIIQKRKRKLISLSFNMVYDKLTFFFFYIKFN